MFLVINVNFLDKPTFRILCQSDLAKLRDDSLVIVLCLWILHCKQTKLFISSHISFLQIGETIIMQCQASDEELQNFERVISKFTENPQVSSSTQETLSSEEMSVPGSTLPSSSKSIVRNNKRKGRKHKPGSNKWSRRSSG